MGHDATKQLMGATNSNHKDVSCFDVDPASLPAGVAVSLATDGSLSLLKSAGSRIGISLGKSLSNAKRTAVVRTGELVPLKLALKRASGNVTITSYANLLTGTPDTVTIDGTAFTAQAGAATPGAATFQAATSNDITAASLAAQINAHATAGAKVKAVATNAVVNIYALNGGAGGNALTLAYADLGTATIGATVSGAVLSGGSDTYSDISYVSKGAKAYINDLNGLGDFSTTDSTISDAIYKSGVLTGVDEAGNNHPCALVDMVGGL